LASSFNLGAFDFKVYSSLALRTLSEGALRFNAIPFELIVLSDY
jgi:hypothetical protein